MEDLNDEINELKKNKGTIDDFFISTPYDEELNLDGFLSKKVFNEKIRIEKGYNKSYKLLMDSIESYQKGKRIILLNGFAGTGKTTFIHYFAEKNDFHNVFFDFEEINDGLIQNENNNNYHSGNEHILELIKTYFLQPGFISKENVFELTKQTFLFIFNEKSKFIRHRFISEDFYEVLSNVKESNINDDFIIGIISKFNYKDTFTFLFTLLFKFHNQKEKVIIYFDNLDKVDLEYLTENFMKNFQLALNRASTLAQSSIFKRSAVRFNLRFRFVFCLRDANGILFNQHIADRVRSQIKVMPVTLSLSQIHFEDIINRRISLLEEVYKEEELGDTEYSGAEFLKNMRTLINDSYFKKVFIPLFNNDYRNSALALLEAVRKISKSDNFFYKEERLEYGARGYLLFSLIQKFFKDNFISEYPFLNGSIKDVPHGHYCFIDRMIITVLCHNSRFTMKNLGNESGKSCSLYSQLIVELEIIYNYDYHLIFEAISRLFTYHESENWVHLISILNKSVRKKEDFNEELNALKELNFLRKKDLDNNHERINELIKSLDNVKIKLNPSAYAYIKYIMPHFEFYSTISGGEEPLYQNFYVKKVNIYKYEEILNSVYEKVKTHKMRMEKFYESQMTKVLPSKASFYTSKYCFKLLGDGNRFDRGYFHITRIITSQIDYLDRFRHKLLMFEIEKNIFDRLDFNKNIVLQIEKYVLLLQSAGDDRANKNLLPDLNQKITKIKASNYLDFKTRIRLPNNHLLRN